MTYIYNEPKEKGSSRRNKMNGEVLFQRKPPTTMMMERQIITIFLRSIFPECEADMFMKIVKACERKFIKEEGVENG